MSKQVMIVVSPNGHELVTVSDSHIMCAGYTYVWGDTLESARKQLEEIRRDHDEWKRYRNEFGQSRYFAEDIC